MLFHSPEFIFLFLPVALSGYYLLGSRNVFYAQVWILISSLVFYYLGMRSNLFLLLFSILANYLFGYSICKSEDKFKKRIVLTTGLILNIGIFVYYKSLPLFLENTKYLGKNGNFFIDTFIPLGFSFFTLQQIAFLIDIYKNKIKSEGIIPYALFVSYFPQLVAGPIVRFQELMPQIKKKSTYKFNYQNLAVGSTIFIAGIAKKNFCADKLAVISNAVFNGLASGKSLTMFEAWGGAVTFAIQLYFNFSAYSDMAIGISRMFGIKLPINFNSPHRAKDFNQMMARWHITLYRYYNDYMAKPLFIQLKKLPLTKSVSRIRFAICASSFLMFVFSGLWHGFSVNFLLWGSINGILIVLLYLWKEYKRSHARLPVAKSSGISMTTPLYFIVGTLFVVMFRIQDFGLLVDMYKSMAGLNGISFGRSFSYIFTDILNISHSSYITLDGFFPVSGISFIYFFKYFITTGLILFFSPNIYEFLYDYSPALDVDKVISKPKIRWAPSRLWAFIMALLTVTLICYYLSCDLQTMTFEYFQF